MSNIIDQIEKENLRPDAPKVEIGDTVKVFVKVVEGNKERLQAYEGTVIAIKNGSVRESFTVRRISYGVGIERTFPLHSPRIDHVEIVRKGKARRAKLYYLRERTGKAVKLKEKETNTGAVKKKPVVKAPVKKKPAAKKVEGKVVSKTGTKTATKAAPAKKTTTKK